MLSGVKSKSNRQIAESRWRWAIPDRSKSKSTPGARSGIPWRYSMTARRCDR